MKIYIQADSKAAINRGLANGEAFTGFNHSIFDPNQGEHRLEDCPEGTVVAIWSKMSGGSPVAKSWGEWNGSKLK